MSGLSPEQVDALLAPLDPRRVRTVQGNAHLESWDIRRHLLRVFGWSGWSFEVISCDCILERSKWDEDSTHKGRHTVVYRVVGRLTIRDIDGNVLSMFEDGATGDSQNQPSFGDAHDLAMKTACSQALKRCAVNLGDRFGLSLYNDGGTEAVVGKSLAHTGETAATVSEHVHAGELEVDGGGSGAASAPSAAVSTPTLLEQVGILKDADAVAAVTRYAAGDRCSVDAVCLRLLDVTDSLELSCNTDGVYSVAERVKSGPAKARDALAGKT